MAANLRYLTLDDKRALSAGAQRASYVEDDVILREGEERNALFVVLTGSARIERVHMDFRYEISRVGSGQIFGEMGFVEGFVASASVVANEALEVEVISAAQVQEITERDGGFAGRFYHSLAEILSQRLRETTVRNLSDFAWGGTDPASRGITNERYVPSDEDSWGGPNWDIEDDDGSS